MVMILYLHGIKINNNNNNETEQPHYPTKIYIVIPDTASTSIGEYSFLSYIFILNPVEN